MTDRIVEFPNRYLLTLPDGTSILVNLTPEPGEIIDAGTLLNKLTLLSDNTAAMLGLTSADPTVNEALAQVPTPIMFHLMMNNSPELTVDAMPHNAYIGVDADNVGRKITAHNVAQYVNTKSTSRESTFQKLIMGRLF